MKQDKRSIKRFAAGWLNQSSMFMIFKKFVMANQLKLLAEILE